MLRREQLEKQPTEEFPIDVNFGSAVPLGSTELVSAIASAVKWPRRQPNNKTPATLEIMLSDTPVLVGNDCGGPKLRARILLKGGISDYEYQITTIGIFDNGAKLEHELFVRVKER